MSAAGAPVPRLPRLARLLLAFFYPTLKELRGLILVFFPFLSFVHRIPPREITASLTLRRVWKGFGGFPSGMRVILVVP
jgi:hypothetical protein